MASQVLEGVLYAETAGFEVDVTPAQDPMLDALEGRVTSANQNIKAAFARLQQARAETRVQDRARRAAQTSSSTF